MTQSTEQERPKREDFEKWAISTNQGYDLTRNQSGRMQTYEHDKTEHAWRGFFHGMQAACRAPAVPVQWKDHQTAKLVNDLRECAINYHNAGQLRERIAHIIRPLVDGLRGAPAVPMTLSQAAESMRITKAIPVRIIAASGSLAQPPEAQTNCANLDQLNKNNGLAAPVQLPELTDSRIDELRRMHGLTKQKGLRTFARAIDKQVRQLLAAQEQSNG